MIYAVSIRLRSKNWKKLLVPDPENTVDAKAIHGPIQAILLSIVSFRGTLFVQYFRLPKYLGEFDG